MKGISLFQGILLGTFGIAAVVGLIVFSTHTSQTSTSSIGTVTIWGTLPKEGMQGLLITAAQTDASFKEVSYTEKDATTLPQDLAAAIAIGKGPDLLITSQEELRTLAKFLLPIPFANLPQSTFNAAFVGEGKLLATEDGTGYYGMPFLVDPLVLYSNRAILATNGIAKPPATWEALTGLAPKIVATTPTRQITRALIALGTYNNVKNARGVLSTLFLQTGVPLSTYGSGGFAANLGNSSADSSAPGQSVLGFYTQFADPSKLSYTWNASLDNSQRAFIAGDLALYLGYASEAAYLTEANPNLDYDASPMPQPETATTKTVYARLYSLMIPRGAQNSAGAFQVAALLTNAAEQADAASATGLAPASLTALSADAPTNSVGAVAYAEALYAKGWLSPSPATTDAIFSSMIGDVVSGRSPSSVALTGAEQSLTAALQKL